MCFFNTQFAYYVHYVFLSTSTSESSQPIWIIEIEITD